MKRDKYSRLTPEAKRQELHDLLASIEGGMRQEWEKNNIEAISLADSLRDMELEDKEVTQYLWPFKTLQDRLGGYWPGELYTVGGTTGIGKSLIAAFLALRFALDGGQVLYFSTEMKHQEITRRLWAMWKSFLGDKETFIDLYINYADNRYSITTDLITAMLERNQERTAEGMERKYDLVVVDNLHWFMRGGDSVADDIGIVTKAIKEIAVKFNCSVIMVSHVNREAGNLAKNTTPPMHFLKGSSYIEQDSDAVLMVTRGEDENGIKTNESFISLEKNRRNGKTFRNLRLLVSENLTFSEARY